MRKEWNTLSSREQHSKFKEFVQRLKNHYTEIQNLSNSVHARLGHRKKWIYAAVKAAGKEPRTKKDKANPFNWAAEFYKLDLTTLHESVKLIFAPSHYLPLPGGQGHDELENLWDKAQTRPNKTITTNLITLEAYGFDLWKEWVRRTDPCPLQDLATIRNEQVPDDNPFRVLEDEGDQPST